MSENLPTRAADFVEHIKIILKSHKCSIEKDDQEFFRYLSYHTFQYRDKYSRYKTEIKAFQLANHRKTLKRMKKYGEYIISELDQMPAYDSEVLDCQLKKINPLEGFDSDESFAQFKKDLSRFVQTMGGIIDIMSPLRPGSPVKKHVDKKIQFQYVQLVAAECINQVSKKPTSNLDGYFCELVGYLLEIVTGEEKLDTYRIVHDVFSMIELPNPKYG